MAGLVAGAGIAGLGIAAIAGRPHFERIEDEDEKSEGVRLKANSESDEGERRQIERMR